MKIGDLVRLSAYGKQRQRAQWIDRDDVGLIVKVVTYNNNSWPPDYMVHWTRTPWSRKRSWMFKRHNTRKDLMYAK